MRTAKKVLAPALAIVALVAIVAFSARAASILIGSMSTVNNTTAYSPTNALGTFSYPGGRLVIQNGGLTDTNALRAYLEVSSDGTNGWAVVDTYNPSVTNAGAETWVPSPAPKTLYYRLRVVTTNSVQVGATMF